MNHSHLVTTEEEGDWLSELQDKYYNFNFDSNIDNMGDIHSTHDYFVNGDDSLSDDDNSGDNTNENTNDNTNDNTHGNTNDGYDGNNKHDINGEYDSNVECDINSKNDANDRYNVNGEWSNDLKELIKRKRGWLRNSTQFALPLFGQLSHPYLDWVLDKASIDEYIYSYSK